MWLELMSKMWCAKLQPSAIEQAARANHAIILGMGRIAGTASDHNGIARTSKDGLQLQPDAKLGEQQRGTSSLPDTPTCGQNTLQQNN